MLSFFLWINRLYFQIWLLSTDPNKVSPASKTEFQFSALIDQAKEYLKEIYDQIFSVQTFIQIILIFASIFLSVFLSRILIYFLRKIQHPIWQKLIESNRIISILIRPVIIYLLLALCQYGYTQLTQQETHILNITLQLSAVWIIIRLISGLIKNAFWSKIAAISAWSLAALNIIGLSDNLIVFLDQISFQASKTRISVWIIIKAIVLISILVLIAYLLSKQIKNKIHKTPGLTPSVRILFGQILQVILFITAIFIGMTSLGIDLSFLAIFGGAIGLGIGFGLQSVIANFISGIILLIDRSLKPGDVISINDTYGIVRSLNLRYSAILTRDGIEHLIPNETFITERVINWSHSDHKVRIKQFIGVSYHTDLRLAQKLAVQATQTISRVLKKPAPVCHLINFGDSSVNLQIRFWIIDPEKGTNNVSSEVLLAIWDSFKEHKIEFPFPQRDIHLKSEHPLSVNLLK